MAQEQSTLINGRLSPRFLRLGWLLVFLLVAGLDIAGIPYRYAEVLAEPYTIMARRGVDSQVLVIQALNGAGISRAGYTAYLTGLEVLQFLPFLIFGILIFRFRPGDRGAELISLLLLVGNSESFLSSSLTHLFGIWAGRSISEVTSLALTLVFFLFPDGRFVPRWTMWVIIPFELLSVPAIFFPGSRWDPNQSALPVILIMSLALFGTMVYAQIYRYRRISGPVERLQTRWVVAGLAALPVFLITNSFLLPALAPSLTVINAETIRYHILINLLILQPLLLVLPIGMGISLLRYRLYDLDIIIRKTLVYAVVTAVLAILYFGGVLLLQTAFARLGAGQSPAALVLSTLLIAALFNPLRRRVQDAVDRRFYRKKYDAERALTAFAAQTRDEVDMEQISAELVSALEETVQPDRVILWLEADGLQPADSPSPASGGHPSTSRAGMIEMKIASDDPLRAYVLKESGLIEIEALELDSAALRRLKDAGVKISTPLISQGELIGLLSLGRRRSEQGYSSDDGRLISSLATRVAPVVRVAQLVHQQQFEARRRERIEQELRVARLVQETLLPKDIPSIPGWELAAHWQPAREMSGDFYDFLPFPDGRLGLIIGDVSGKGMPAALVMAIIQNILRAAAERIGPPAEVLERANNLILPRIPANMFATCLYMILDPVNGCLQFANAGHNLPILQTDRGLVEPRATGMPLGLLPGMSYDQNEVQLTPGNRLLMYTDGLVEAHNPQGEMFGNPYLNELIGQGIQVPSGSSGGASLIKLLIAGLADFTGSGWEQEDDVTLVTLDYVGSGWPVENPAQT